MAVFKRPGLNAAQLRMLRSARMRVQTKGQMVRAQLVLPDGRQFQALLKATPEALSGDELGGRFLKKLGRGMKKAVLAPVKIAHKVTHSGPIEKMHKQVQGFVGKNLPIAKPFINIHNSLAKPIHKAIAGKKVKKAITAKAIANVTKNLPPATKAAATQALVVRAKQDDALREVATKAAKAKVVHAAAKALKKNPANAAARKVLSAAKPLAGFYVVTDPRGRVSKIPASKVG